MGRDREGVENKTFYVSSRDVRIVCPRLKREVSIMRRPWPTGAVSSWNSKEYFYKGIFVHAVNRLIDC